MRRKLPRITTYCETCGEAIETTASKMEAGGSRFCSRSCSAKTMKRRHGHFPRGKPSKTYMTWAAMHQRCRNPKHKQWHRYGGRGIEICERWNVFPHFLADMGERPKGLTLDRINNDGNYEPENCRWISAKEQCNNQSTNLIVSYKGKAQPVSLLADELGVSAKCLRWRIKAKWPEDDWASAPYAAGHH